MFTRQSNQKNSSNDYGHLVLNERTSGQWGEMPDHRDAPGAVVYMDRKKDKDGLDRLYVTLSTMGVGGRPLTARFALNPHKIGEQHYDLLRENYQENIQRYQENYPDPESVKLPGAFPYSPQEELENVFHNDVPHNADTRKAFHTTLQEIMIGFKRGQVMVSIPQEQQITLNPHVARR